MKKKQNNWPFYTRRVIQFISFSLFLYLLLFLDPLTERDASVNVFLRMSPLSAIGAMMAARKFIFNYWPAFLILFLTIPFGRYFCAWICPLGTTIDITDGFFAGFRKYARKSVYDGRRIKYYLLAFLLLSLLLGLQCAGWFDPLSIATSVFAMSIHPYIVHLGDSFFGYLGNIPFFGHVFSFFHTFFQDVLFAYHAPFFRAHGILLFVFILIITFGIVLRRYWCRNICPMGALFALFSDWSFFKRNVSSTCTSCGLCVEKCGMGAIGSDGKSTKEGECILCMTCRKVCPEHSVTFRRQQPPIQKYAIDLSRRAFVVSGITSAAIIPFLKLNYRKKINKENVSVIRPPGAVNEKEFLARCIRCGECMKVCKTNGLHPVLLEYGIDGVWTPQLIPRIGYCDYGCVLCTRVCPSGAIKRLPLEEKRWVALGKARIDHNRCIPWVGYSRLPELKKEWQDFNCGVCEEVCPVPTKAIHFNTYVDEQGREIRRPFVREDVCVGCGFCEKVCPVLGTSAIVVEGIQPQTTVKKERDLKILPSGNFLPKTLGNWKRITETKAYEGKEKLYEYINGGAEPYLSYSFIRVTNAEYGDDTGKEILIDIWEFETAEDAFGVFTKDRAGIDIKLGNRAALFENYLCIWNDVYCIKVEPRQGDIPAGEITAAGKSVIDLMPYKKEMLPDIVRYLPENNLVKESLKFFHKKIILDNIFISDNFIEENVFHLSEQTNAVIAEYEYGEEVSLLLMLVKYPDSNIASSALEDAIQLWRAWGENEMVTDAIHTFQSKNAYSTSFLREKHFLAATFLSKNREEGEKLLKSVLEKL
ncbi:MAG: 4Fe-4S dicluster domain-containing protein [Candidatus Kuenenia sp.]|nr:4Fe-4S dicluster domain-containing protein [Candidatus Kuenenia hertensis]